MEESKRMMIGIKLFPRTRHLRFILHCLDLRLNDGQRIANQSHRLLKIEYLCSLMSLEKMDFKTISNELQNILSGKSEVSFGEPIQAITRYLRESLGTSEKTQKNESNKSEETARLIDYIND